MEKWRCIRCETLNKQNRIQCIVCDLERKDLIKKTIPPSYIMEKWRCTGCGTLNEQNRIQCIVCDLEKKGVNKKTISPRWYMMEKWRCIRCETLNEQNRIQCVVCDLEKKDMPKKIIPPRKNSCALVGCSRLAVDGSDYCSEHKDKVCPICKKELKMDGEDFCIFCMERIINKSTKGLRIVNGLFSFIDILLLIIFIMSLLLVN